ncbi:hypothetical protein PFISCL1PPCAC_9126, partial [Pristionchus fissidentatus]
NAALSMFLLTLAVISLASVAATSAHESVCKDLIDGPKLEFSENLPPATAVNNGDRLELVCSVLAAPTAAIIWLHDGKEVSVQEGTKEHLLGGGKRLGISMLQSRLVRECATAEDAGTYTCVAISPCGKALINQRSTVAVAAGKDSTCVPTKAPVIALHTESRMELPHNIVQLACRSEHPFVRIHWERVAEDESTQRLDLANSGFMQLPTGDLIVDPLTLTETEGGEIVALTLRCVVIGEHGKAHADSAIIFMDEE